jgi:IstB-like ATP binding protein/Integrase core domain
MSRCANCWDNAVAESLFSNLKSEQIKKRIYQTWAEAKSEIFDYIGGFYNRVDAISISINSDPMSSSGSVRLRYEIGLRVWENARLYLRAVCAQEAWPLLPTPRSGGEVFVEPAMTLAAVDRLVHHSTILEMNVESYRRRAAQTIARPASLMHDFIHAHAKNSKCDLKRGTIRSRIKQQVYCKFLASSGAHPKTHTTFQYQ